MKIISDTCNLDGWIKCLIDGHYCEAKVFDETSRCGVNGCRVSKLCIAAGKEWDGLDESIYNYDRGLDFDETPPGLLAKVLKFWNALPILCVTRKRRCGKGVRLRSQ